MTPDEAAAQQSMDQPMSSGQVDHRPTWAAPTVTRLDVTRSLGGSGPYPDGGEGNQFSTN